MRRKRERILSFATNDEGLPKTVREYRAKYKGISRVLDDHPGVLDMVHRDLKDLSEGGRQGRDHTFARRAARLAPRPT